MKPAFFALLASAALGALTSTALAEDKPVLTVYTYDSFVSDWGPGPQIETAFEATCECDLKFIAAGDGAALLSRVRLEGTRSSADIVLGLDTNLTAVATETGLFAPHNRNPWLDLPVEWNDPLFLPYDWGYFAFVYDETRLDTVPDSFEALINLPEDVKIVIQDPRTSTPGLGLLLWVKLVYGDKAGDFWQRLKPRILTVTKGWSEAYGMFLEGEAEMVLSYTTSPAYHILAEDDLTKYAAGFAEGHYMQIEVAGILKSSKQPELANKFMGFMTSTGFQGVIPTTNWMYPAVFPEAGLPKAFSTLITPEESLLIAPDQIEATRQEALEEWLSALSN